MSPICEDLPAAVDDLEAIGPRLTARPAAHHRSLGRGAFDVTTRGVVHQDIEPPPRHSSAPEKFADGLTKCILSGVFFLHFHGLAFPISLIIRRFTHLHVRYHSCTRFLSPGLQPCNRSVEFGQLGLNFVVTKKKTTRGNIAQGARPALGSSRGCDKRQRNV